MENNWPNADFCMKKLLESIIYRITFIIGYWYHWFIFLLKILAHSQWIFLLQCSDDNQSETSDSSIEVVSMDTSDLHSLESIQLPQIPSASSGPFLVLRLRSKEKGQ